VLSRVLAVDLLERSAEHRRIARALPHRMLERRNRNHRLAKKRVHEPGVRQSLRAVRVERDRALDGG
jgi:hypothetical protein